MTKVNVSTITRIENYFSSNDFKNDAAWVLLALSVAALGTTIAVALVGLNIAEANNNKYIAEHPGSASDRIDSIGRGSGVVALVYGGSLSVVGIIFSIILICKYSNKEEPGAKEKIIRHSLISGAFTLLIFGVVMAALAKAYQNANSEPYYLPERFGEVQKTLTAFRATGISLSVLGAFAFAGTTLGLQGLKAFVCGAKKLSMYITEKKIIASRNPAAAPLDDND